MINELKGPVLNLGSPQSELGPAVLKMIADIVLPDEAYLERVKRHYAMVRERIDGKRVRCREAVHDRKRRRRRRRKVR